MRSLAYEENLDNQRNAVQEKHSVTAITVDKSLTPLIGMVLNFINAHSVYQFIGRIWTLRR